MKMALSGRHDLDLDTLRKRIDERVAFYDQQYPSLEIRKHYTWTDPHHARAEYRGGAGQLTLGANEVALVLELPFFARLARDRIDAFVRREMELLLAPAARA